MNKTLTYMLRAFALVPVVLSGTQAMLAAVQALNAPRPIR